MLTAGNKVSTRRGAGAARPAEDLTQARQEGEPGPPISGEISYDYGESTECGVLYFSGTTKTMGCESKGANKGNFLQRPAKPAKWKLTPAARKKIAEAARKRWAAAKAAGKTSL